MRKDVIFTLLLIFIIILSGCTQAPIEEKSQPAVSLPANTVPASSTPDFRQQQDVFYKILQTSMMTGDFDTLQSLMQDPFTIAGWQAESSQVDVSTAVEHLRSQLLPHNTAVSFSPLENADTLLGGLDPYSMWGTNVHIANVILSQGWGQSASGEALLLISQVEDGSYRWYGILYAPAGFMTPAAEQQAQPLQVEASEVDDVSVFQQILIDALTSDVMDEVLIQSMMSDVFVIEGWQASGSLWTPAEAMLHIKSKFPSAPLTEQYNPFANISEILGNVNVYSMFPDVAGFIFSQGWGADGNDEVLMVITHNPDGSFCWSHLVIAAGGFNKAFSDTIQGSQNAGLVITDLQSFKSSLLDALYVLPRDYKWLSAFMDSGFQVELWNTSSDSISVEQAAMNLQNDWLPLSSAFSYRSDVDAASILGRDIKTSYPGVVDCFYSEGWGIDNQAASIILIAQRDDGSYYWYGMIYAPAGF